MEQHRVVQHAFLARRATPLVWDNQYVAPPTQAGAPLANTNIFQQPQLLRAALIVQRALIVVLVNSLAPLAKLAKMLGRVVLHVLKKEFAEGANFFLAEAAKTVLREDMLLKELMSAGIVQTSS